VPDLRPGRGIPSWTVSDTHLPSLQLVRHGLPGKLHRAAASGYDVTYFSSAYRAQYGRTYLEDFESDQERSRERVRIMREQIAEGLDGMVIDVGCAYGPFLDALKDAGIPGYGRTSPPTRWHTCEKSCASPRCDPRLRRQPDPRCPAQGSRPGQSVVRSGTFRKNRRGAAKDFGASPTRRRVCPFPLPTGRGIVCRAATWEVSSRQAPRIISRSFRQKAGEIAFTL